MLKLFKKYLTISFATLLYSGVYAQVPVIQLERDSILIGEQITVSLQVMHPKSDSISIDWPQLDGSFGEFIELLDSSNTDTITVPQNNDMLVQMRRILITSFDSGYYAIDPFIFIINGDTLSTEQQFIYVNTVPVDLEKGLKSLKGIYVEPFDLAGFLKKWIPIVLGIILLIGIILFLIKKYKNKEVEEKVVEIIEPAHIIAYRSLGELEKKKLLENNYEKEYQSELTGILRRYLEDRFDVQAMEQTTSETINNLKYSSISQKLKEDIVQVLNMADAVKFAKSSLSYQINMNAFSKVKKFIDETKIIESKEIEGDENKG